MIDFTPVNLTAGDNRNYPYNLARIVESYKEVYGMHINSSINGTTEIRHPNTILEDAIPCAVIITGPARNGKDTMVNYFEEVFPSLPPILSPPAGHIPRGSTFSRTIPQDIILRSPVWSA